MTEWTPPNAEYPPPKIGEPALHRAARLGDRDEIVRLAGDGFDINEVFDIGLDPGARPMRATPLMIAAGSGDGANLFTLRTLLDLGADPTILLNERSVATFAATGLGWNYRPGGDAVRLRAALAAGSPLAGDTEAANRMLCKAARKGDLEIVEILVEAGLEVNGFWDQEEAKARERAMLSDIDSSSPDEMDACELEFREIQKELDEELFESSTSAPYSFEIPILMAAESGNPDCVRYLVDNGANIFARDNSKRSAIFHAGSKETASLFQEQGIPIEDEDEIGWSPLVHSVNSGLDAIEKTKWLIELGANVNGTHDRGYTVFMSAASSIERHVDVLKLLVASGANPHAFTELGFNAFHAAIDVNGEANEEESVRSILSYLSELGVDIHHRNNSGETPLARAKNYGTEIESRILLELGAKQ